MGGKALGFLENWKLVVPGIYRYDVVEGNIAYEIVIRYHDGGTDILTAKALLYFTVSDSQHFKREILLGQNTVQQCLYEAAKDFENGMAVN